MSQARPEAPSQRPSENPDILWSGLTHVGRFRSNNEDAFLALKFDGHEVNYLGKTGRSSLAGSDFVFAVSDGMGGAKSGEFASKISVDRITRLLPKSFRLSAAGLEGGFQDVLIELMTSIHADLVSLGRFYQECAGMGATLSLCWFRPGWMYFAHIGDSRIYHLSREGRFSQLTHDHSHVGWLRRTGRLNEREARSHPGRNSLNQALGAGNQFVEPQIGAVALRAGDRFLICSDGLVDGLWDRRIEELLKTGPSLVDEPSAVGRLVEESVAASGRDNTTAVLVELPAPKATTLLFVYGTLKRGGSNHRYMERQSFVGAARTPKGYTLYDLGGYPGMIADTADEEGVTGEVWSVDDACLASLDVLEGTAEGLYRRSTITLLDPFAKSVVETYVYLKGVEGRRRIGSTWSE
jgi:protein phosphatase